MATLKGTEKQIYYAKRILNGFNECIKAGIARSVKTEHIDFLKNMASTVNNIENASEIIEKSKNVPDIDSIPENMSELIEILRNKFSK